MSARHATIAFSTVLLVLTMAAFPARSAQAQVEAVAGEPFGVGQVTLRLAPGQKLDPTSDDRFVVVERRGRVLYSVVEQAPVRRVLRQLLEIQAPLRVTIHFLFRGEGPLELTVFAPGPQQYTVPVRYNPVAHRTMADAWWRNYTAATGRLLQSGDYPPLIEHYLSVNLAQRLRRPLPAPVQQGRELNDFQRLLGPLLGSETIRTATRIESLLGGTDESAAAATLPLPEFLPRVAPDPAAGAEGAAVERIAMHVPEECWYARFGSYANYAWLQTFLQRWGGDTRNMINRRGVNYRLNERIQNQLGVRQSALASVLGPAAIEDVAMIGSDLLLRDGPGIGVILQARNNLAVGLSMKGQRKQVLDSTEGATEETLEIAGRKVSLLSTPDHRVRSFYAQDDKFHLLTTSRAIVERFFEAGSGKGSLGASAEFQLARGAMPQDRGDSVFVYFSKALFHQWTSPQHYVESRRRMKAATDVQLIELARLAARAEGSQAESIDELIDDRYLPAGFGQRPDGSQLMQDGDSFTDSLRGAIGSFLPVADVPVERMTASEANHYRTFLDWWQQRWTGVGPVMIGIGRQPVGEGPDPMQRMTIEAHVGGNGPGTFAPLSTMLGPATRQHVAPVAGDLVAAEFVLSGQGLFGLQQGNQPNHLFAGLRGGNVPQTLPSGRMSLALGQWNFVRGYVGAWPRPGLLSILSPPRPASIDPDGFSRIPNPPGWQRRRDDFLLLSFRRDVLQEVTPQLTVVEAPRPAQVRLRIEDLSASQMTPLVAALGYMQARLTSQSGSRLMNKFANQLQVPHEECRAVAERLIHAELACPLGGDYVVTEHQGGLRTWTSSAVDSRNQFQLNAIPSDYSFPMLEWFRGADAELALTEAGLSIRARVDIADEAVSE